MPSLNTRHRLIAALVILGATGAAFAGPAVTRSGEGTGTGPVRCELEMSRRGSSVELTALVHADSRADKATRGEYSLRISGPGTNISQGGPFAVSPGGTERLGTVTLGGGSGTAADLKIVVDGRTLSCTERVGGRA